MKLADEILKERNTLTLQRTVNRPQFQQLFKGSLNTGLVEDLSNRLIGNCDLQTAIAIATLANQNMEFAWEIWRDTKIRPYRKIYRRTYDKDETACLVGKYARSLIKPGIDPNPHEFQWDGYFYWDEILMCKEFTQFEAKVDD